MGMQNMRKNRAAVLLFAVAGLFLVMNGTFYAQKVDSKKLYAEIAGDYEFDMQGQVMVVTFYVEEGKLFGAPEGEDTEEVVPVEGEALKFTIDVPQALYELTFVRDESGKIFKCLVSANGMEMEGIKIKK